MIPVKLPSKQYPTFQQSKDWFRQAKEFGFGVFTNSLLPEVITPAWKEISKLPEYVGGF